MIVAAKSAAAPSFFQIGVAEVTVGIAGVALGLLLGMLSGFSGTWAAVVMVVAVLGVGALYVRLLGIEVGLMVLLLVANAVDHFTFRVGSIDLRAEQVAMLAALGGLAATRLKERPIELFRPRGAEWALLAWLALSAVSSAIDSPDRRLSLRILVLIGISSLAFFLPRRLLSGDGAKERLEVVVRWLLIVFATEAAYGSIAYLLHAFGPSISIGPNPASGRLEAYGTLWEQNVFGAFAAAGAVAWVYLGPTRFRRAWVGVALCMSGLIDSLTRAAWLAAAAVGAIGLVLPGLRRRIDLMTAGTGLLGGVLAAAAVLVSNLLGQYTVPVSSGGGAPQPHRGFFSAILNMTDFIGRINQLSPVWSDVHGHYLILGRGTASFEALHVANSVPEHIASLPLLVLNDTGVAGVLVFVAFVVMLVAHVWSQRQDEAVVGLSQMALVIAIANLATQTTELMIGWLLLGILVAAVDLAPAAEQAPRGERQLQGSLSSAGGPGANL